MWIKYPIRAPREIYIAMKCGLMLSAAVTDPMLWPCTPVLQVPGSARVFVMLVETGGEPGPSAWLRPLPWQGHRGHPVSVEGDPGPCGQAPRAERQSSRGGGSRAAGEEK